MNIEGCVALVTGAGRGLGQSFAQALLDHGAAKVYATARDTSRITDPRLTPLALDVTDPDSVAAAVAAAQDVHIVINNAGISTGTSILGDPDNFRREFETNFYGPIAIARAFAPVLGRNGGGALVNMLSALSWVTIPTTAGYCASKSAMWSATNAMRLDLRDQGTLVTAIHAGYIDTDMTARLDAPKISPELVAQLTMAAIEANEPEVLCDDVSRNVRAGLSGPLTALYPSLAPTPA
jgi:NAD(P)-dependent dehydrogenase (short-subunit alcohol dehydrogenase family)